MMAIRKPGFWRFLAAFASLTLFSPVASAADWAVVGQESSVTFEGTQTGTAFEGQFETFSARIHYDPSAPEEATVLATIDVGSARTGDTQRDEALPGKDWFFAEMFPEATYRATGFRDLGDGRFETDGTLTIRDVSLPVTLPFSLTIDGARANMSAELTLNRRAFGVGGGPWSEGKWVGLEVDVKITIVAERKP